MNHRAIRNLAILMIVLAYFTVATNYLPIWLALLIGFPVGIVTRWVSIRIDHWIEGKEDDE